jgi:hypothetical protein
MTMADVPTTNLTVAKLKALCVLNDLSASGKKADLLARLLEAGVDKETLGVEVFDEATATFHTAPVDGEEPAPEEGASGEDDDAPGEEKVEESEEDVVDNEPIMLSLEDEETITPSAEPVEVEPTPTKKRQPARSSTKAEPIADDDEVLEAEILEADLLDDEVEEVEEVVAEPPSSRPTPEKSTAGSPMTLKEMVQRPQSVAVLLALLILGAGGWYYVNNQLEPFTADSLRYGDSMGYIISGTGDGYDETTSGAMIATGEYVSLVLDQLEDPPDYCKVRLLFEGQSEATITEGTSRELFTQSSDDRLGAVEVKGGQGLSWLTVESKNEMEFSQFDIFGHTKTNQKCNDFSEGSEGTADITLTTWTELRERVTIATQLDTSLANSGGAYDGTAFTYGVGGLFGGLEDLSPGLGMVVAPVELAQFFGNAYITTDATGTSSGWEWRVTGSEKVGTTNMWKVTASHRDVRDFCLGYANMNLWLDADSPWAARQSVDIAISSSESSQNDCSTWQQRGVEAVLPEGELELHHSFERTYHARGVKAVELGKAYDNRPESNEMDPDEDELSAWAVDGTHLPDNSTQRTHPLDLAMTCIPEFNIEASGAVEALESHDGYVWRAVDAKNGSATDWNISWVGNDNAAGWLLFSVAGSVDDLTCTFLAKGIFEDTMTHDRDAIPEALPLEAVEQRIMDAQRFPALTGPDALFSSDGYHDQTSIGYLVVVPGSGLGIDFGDFFDTTGATTLDLQRQWEEDGVDHRFSLLVDGTDGRLIGWTLLEVA